MSKYKTAGLLVLWSTIMAAQSWVIDTESFYPEQPGGAPYGFHVDFKTNGPLNKDWIYGTYLDSDSLRRCVAYRDKGRWKPLPFSVSYGSTANDIEMYGDTLYIAGDFGNIVLDKDSSTLPNTGLIKWFDDSLWVDPQRILGVLDMSIKGDTLLMWGDSYVGPVDTHFIHFMTPDGGATWQYPYSIVHPTEAWADFGSIARIEVLDNGDILTLNYGPPSGNAFKGISRWDGQQWHAYGNGLFGSGFTAATDFEFYKGELYMGGTFAQYNTFYGDTTSYIPQNPGNSIVRWDGSQWQGLGGGILEGGVRDIFVQDSFLYCFTFAGVPEFHRFGDALIPYLAGWDGHQWCGTPGNYGAAPDAFGIVNDTLFVAFPRKTTIDGDPVGFMNYFDGDYLHGPDAVCSTLGLQNNQPPLNKEGVKIWPNPFIDRINISGVAAQAEYSLYNSIGQKIQSGQLSDAVIAVSEDLPAGSYFLAITTREGKTSRHSIVKQ